MEVCSACEEILERISGSTGEVTRIREYGFREPGPVINVSMGYYTVSSFFIYVVITLLTSEMK